MAKTSYLEEMKVYHDRIAQGVNSGTIGRQDFGGLKLSHLGDGLLIDREQVAAIKENIPEMKQLESVLRTKLVLAEGLVFDKQIFFKMLERVGSFVTFRHLDQEGMTHSVGNIPDKSRFKYPKLAARVVAATIFGLLLWAIIANVASPGNGIFVGICALIVSAFVGGLLYVWSELSALKQLKRLPAGKVIDFLWPQAHDYARNEGLRQIRVRVKFPTERPVEVDDNIYHVVQAGQEIDAKPFLVAHKNAIGINVDMAELVAVKNSDPFMCLETEKCVIVFPNTLFGNIEEEEVMIKRLEESFSSMRYNELN